MRITMSFWCEFSRIKRDDDMMRSMRVKSQNLWMSPWYILAYLNKTQASKLCDAQGIPFFINKVSDHLKYFTWSVCVFLYFV